MELNTASNLSVPSLCLGSYYLFFFSPLLLTGFQSSVCDLALVTGKNLMEKRDTHFISLPSAKEKHSSAAVPGLALSFHAICQSYGVRNRDEAALVTS